MASKINGITIAIGADTSGVTAGLKDITAASVTASKNLKDIDKLLQLDPGNVELAAERQKVLQDAIDATAKKMQTLEAAQGDVKRAFEAGQIDDAQYIAFQRELVNTAKRMQDLERAAQSTEAAQRPLTETVKAQEKQLSELRQRYIDTAAASGRESDEAKELAGKISALSGELAENRSKLNAAEKAADELTGSLDDTGDQAAETERETGKLGEALKGGLVAGAKAAAAAIAGVTAAAAAAVTEVVKMSGEVAEYGDGIDKASQKIGISAEAYQEWDFILQHSGASADVLQGSVKKLSTQMQNAQKVISGTAIADEQLEAQLASGEITSEQYAEAYDKLYDEAYKGIDAFAALGYSMSDLENMGSTEELLADVIARLQEMPESAERTAIATSILGKGAMELGALLNTSAADTEAMREQVHALGGVMSDEAVKDAAAYQDSLQNMQTAMGGLKNSLISELLPSLTTTMDGLASLFSGDVSGIDTALAGIKGFAAQISGELPRIEAVAGAIFPAIADAIADGLPDVLGAGVDIVERMADGIIAGLPRAVSVARQLGGRIVLAVSNLAPKLLTAGVDAVLAIADGLTSALPSILPTVTGLVGRLASQLAANSGQIVPGAVALVKSLADGILASVPVLLSYLPGIVTNIADGLIDGAGELATAGVDLLTAVIDDLPDIIDQILTAIPKIITGLQNAFLQNGQKIMQSGITLLTRLTEALPQIIAQILRAIPTIIGSIVQNIIAHWPDIVSAGYDLFTQLTKDGPAIIRHIVNMPGEIVDNLLGSFRARFADMWQIGRDLFDRVRDGITGMISEAWTWGTDLIDGFIGGIRDKIGQLADIAADCAQTVRDFLGFSEPDKGPLSNFHTFAPDMMQLFAQGIRKNGHVIADALDETLEGVTKTDAVEVQVEARPIDAIEIPPVDIEAVRGQIAQLEGTPLRISAVLSGLDEIRRQVEDVVTAPIRVAIDDFEANVRQAQMKAPAEVPVRSAGSSATITIAPQISVASVSSDYDVRRISDRMIEYISEGLSTLEARQAALQGG